MCSIKHIQKVEANTKTRNQKFYTILFLILKKTKTDDDVENDEREEKSLLFRFVYSLSSKQSSSPFSGSVEHLSAGLVCCKLNAYAYGRVKVSHSHRCNDLKPTQTHSAPVYGWVSSIRYRKHGVIRFDCLSEMKRRRKKKLKATQT